MRTIRLLFKSVRPHQWIKNAFILLPLLFARKIFDIPSVLLGLLSLVIFCMMTGAVYLINDLFDIEEDRLHPVKRYRPLASGLISPQSAIITAGCLLLISLAGGIWIRKSFFVILVIYLLIQGLYNFWLKEIVILDIFCVSSGFFLRVVAGAEAVQVPMSHWLIICTILIAMFLAMGKRRQELVVLGELNAVEHRRVLASYSPYLLDQMIGVITASTLLSYILYCISPETIDKFQTSHMVYTFPMVLYGIFRYLYLVHQKNQGGEPEKMLVSDIPLMLSVLFWALLSMLIIYGVF